VRAVQTETFGSNMDPSLITEVRCVTFSGSRMVDELLQFASRCRAQAELWWALPRGYFAPGLRSTGTGTAASGDGERQSQPPFAPLGHKEWREPRSPLKMCYGVKLHC
jgi:DNA polymerase III epsilon subunit-like protein